MKFDCLQSLACRIFAFIAVSLTAVCAQSAPATLPASELYKQLQNPVFAKSAVLENVVLQRDRVRMTFNGTLFVSAAVEGKVRAAVFVGSGTFQAPAPPIPFEQENVRRMLKADDVSSDFKTAVLRFTDDTAEEMLKGYSPTAGIAVEQAMQIDREFASRLLQENGINIASRELESIVNKETPGVFLAQFAGGKRGRFTYVFDPQTRIPVNSFDINAGEKGLIFTYDSDLSSSDVWMAFYANEAYATGTVPYSDLYDLILVDKYTLKLDLLDPHKNLGVSATMDMVSRFNDVQVVPFTIGQDLSKDEDERRKRQLHVQSASLADGTPVTWLQEPWEAGFSLVLPKAANAGERLRVTVELKGDFMLRPDDLQATWSKGKTDLSGTYFPRSDTSWYPHHGYLNRSKYDIIMLHRKKEQVVAIGAMVKEEPLADVKDAVLTEFRIDQPVPFATFAMAPYEIHREKAKQESGTELPVEFYSLPSDRAMIKEDFILAELNNCVRYFSKFFGEYPYPVFRGAYHPYGYGLGMPTTIMMPDTDRDSNNTFSFIAHETSHQWWGEQVLWRSYQDQWLSEGFAEYSGLMYVNLRKNWSAQKELIERSRRSLTMPPRTLTGVGSGRLNDIGPLIMGHRVETRQSLGAYQALTYDKGGLVLRMLHFLFTDPDTGNGQGFVDLMADFTKRFNGKAASSRQFFAVANERVKDTPLAKRFGYKDLNWFYRQWVMQSYLPSYDFAYSLEADASGGTVVVGDVTQKGVPENEKWFMPLPVVIHLAGGGVARTTIAAYGSQNKVKFRLPSGPTKIELDPELWILSEKSTAKKN